MMRGETLFILDHGTNVVVNFGPLQGDATLCVIYMSYLGKSKCFVR